MREIINGVQATMLQTLADKPGINRAELLRASGVTIYLLKTHFPDLCQRALVDSYKPGNTRLYCLTITEKGLQALAGYAQHQQEAAIKAEKVQASTRNLFEFPVWSPPRLVPMRNNGNVHIASRGVRC